MTGEGASGRAVGGAISSLTALCLALLLVGCSASSADPAGSRSADFVVCEPPRPEICTQEYVPVCAERRNSEGAVERVTRSNRCRACSEAEVTGFDPGACGADPIESPTILDL